MTGGAKSSKLPWLYAGVVLLLYLVLVLGIPLFPEILGYPLSGWFNVGMLIFLFLHTLPLVLAVVHLKQRNAAERGR